MELTREQIDYKMKKAYTGKVITFNTIKNHPVCGKVDRITVESATGELMVIFNINHTRYECDIKYFLENTTRHGNSQRTDTGDPGLQKGD